VAGQEPMADPVVAADGHCYDRATLEAWLRARGPVSPATGAALPHTALLPCKVPSARASQQAPHPTPTPTPRARSFTPRPR
jgi:hypothetical protein